FKKAIELAPDWVTPKVNLGIAYLNDIDRPELIDSAVKVFTEVLEKEPDNPHAHFCLGIILHNRSLFNEARPHFEAVTRIDPNDAHAWYWAGKSRFDSFDSPESYDAYERALKLNPYLNAARYGIAYHRLTADDEKRKRQLLAEANAYKSSFSF